MVEVKVNSGGEGTRTLDLRLAKPPLFQLSYTPGKDGERTGSTSGRDDHRRPGAGHPCTRRIPPSVRTHHCHMVRDPSRVRPRGRTDLPRDGARRRRPALAHARHPQLTTPGNFLFGGCALGAALVALEAASGRPTVWATGHYLSYALTDAELLWDVTLAAVGGHVTQGRAVGSVDGREILTVNAALGKDDLEVAACGSSRPTCLLPASAHRGSCPRCSATPSWTASRSARPEAGPSRRWTVRPAAPTPPCGRGYPATSRLPPPPWPSSATTSRAPSRSPSGAVPWDGASTTRSGWSS